MKDAKLKNAAKGALTSLLISVPIALATNGKGAAKPSALDRLTNSAATIGTGALAGAGVGLGVTAYDEAKRYRLARERFRGLQNKALENAGLLTFTNPNTGSQRAIPARQFSENKLNTVEKAKTVAKGVADKAIEGKLIEAKPTDSTFVGGMKGSANTLIKQYELQGLQALDNLTAKNEIVYGLTHRIPKDFDVDLPEQFEPLVSQVRESDDPSLELDRVLSLIPNEFKEIFISRCKDSDNLEPETGDFNFIGDALKTLGKKILSKGSEAATDTVKKATEAAADTVKDAVKEGAKSAAEDIADKVKDAGDTVKDAVKSTPKFTGEKRDKLNGETRKEFKVRQEQMRRDDYIDKNKDSAVSQVITGLTNKIVKPSTPFDSKIGAELSYDVSKGIAKASKNLTNAYIKKEVVDTISGKNKAKQDINQTLR